MHIFSNNITKSVFLLFFRIFLLHLSYKNTKKSEKFSFFKPDRNPDEI